MFKFLTDIETLKDKVNGLRQEVFESTVISGFFSQHRTLRKQVDDLYVIVNNLLNHLGLEANETDGTPDQWVEGEEPTFVIQKAGTRAKENEIVVPSVEIKISKAKKTYKSKKSK